MPPISFELVQVGITPPHDHLQSIMYAAQQKGARNLDQPPDRWVYSEEGDLQFVDEPRGHMYIVYQDGHPGWKNAPAVSVGSLVVLVNGSALHGTVNESVNLN